MECELNGTRIKYEDGKLLKWRETKTKPSYWWELKGNINKGTGYMVVGINNKTFKFHRVVYLVHNKKWEIHDTCRDNSIDHIDRDKLNNNIENLRVATHSQNMRNTDCKGYTFHKTNGKYVAKIMVECKNIYLGSFVNEDDARNAYLEAKAEYHI